MGCYIDKLARRLCARATWGFTLSKRDRKLLAANRLVCAEQTALQREWREPCVCVDVFGRSFVLGWKPSKRDRDRCGAKTRMGSPCQAPSVHGRDRCRMHGGLSTGPKTPEGRARIAEAQKERWNRWREERIQREM
jgi:hypothetical protein